MLIVLSLIIAFLVAHEIGHLLCALILRLKVDKIGISFRPYPHPYVAVSGVRNRVEYFCFMFSGFFITLSLFILFLITGLLNVKLLYIAITIEILLETNPYHSDFTIAFNVKEKFSLKWYIHFTLWFILINFFYSSRFLFGFFFS